MVVFCVILYFINLFSSWQESLVNVYIWKISEEYNTKNVLVLELKSIPCLYRILTNLLTWFINIHLKEN